MYQPRNDLTKFADAITRLSATYDHESILRTFDDVIDEGAHAFENAPLAYRAAVLACSPPEASPPPKRRAESLVDLFASDLERR